MSKKRKTRFPFGRGLFFIGGACVSGPDRGAPIEDIRSAYKNALLREHAEDMVALAMEKGIELSLEEAVRAFLNYVNGR